ncbi:MAG: phosphodiester glycosidase family protein [Chloroflexota bacterium]
MMRSLPDRGQAGLGLPGWGKPGLGLLRRLLCLVVLLGLPGLAPARPVPAAAQLAAPVLWQSVAPGIEYRKFYLPGPNQVFVARLDRREPSASLQTAIGQGRLSGGAETVREQAARYDQAIGYWGEQWGSREQVAVAINGSYFDTTTGVPWSGMVQAGWYARRFEDRQKTSGFAWTMERAAFIGACVTHRPNKQLLTVDGQGAVPFDGINVPAGEDELIVYTSHYDVRSPQFGADERGLEALVELDRPLLITPEAQPVRGVVRQIVSRPTPDPAGLPIPFDHLVLAAHGAAFRLLNDKLQVGDRVSFSQELRHLNPSCQQSARQDWSGVYASLSGSYLLLQDAALQRLDDLGAVLRNPRTAVAYNDRYVYFIVVDGRDRVRSIGMSMVELAHFARAWLGATAAIAQDGGGSSTMLVNGQVVNRPNADLVDAPAMPQPAAAGPLLPPVIERAVANAWLMVNVLPRQLSERFQPGAAVRITGSGPVNLRLGPGVNYAVLAALQPGQAGSVTPHPLNGVLATGYSWWKLEIDGQSGWVNEEALAEQ